MDHLAQGRYMLGIGASGLPSDWQLFYVDGTSGENRDMTREALDIMLKIWATRRRARLQGQVLDVNVPEPMLRTLKHHIKPLQQPHPPIGIAGFSPGSDTLKLAGERGFIPLSLNLSPGYVASHWDAVVEGAQAQRRTRRPPRLAHRARDFRRRHRRRSATSSASRHDGPHDARVPAAADSGLRVHQVSQARPDVPRRGRSRPSIWPTTAGSSARRDTVRDKLTQMYKEMGGFGTLLHFGFDYADNPEPWFKSMRLMAEEVLPHFQGLDADRLEHVPAANP